MKYALIRVSDQGILWGCTHNASASWRATLRFGIGHSLGWEYMAGLCLSQPLARYR